MNPFPPLQHWAFHLRMLVGLFTAVALIGFLTGFIFLDVSTHLSPQGIIAHYKGLSEEEMAAGTEMKFEKPFKDMLITTHNHILGLSVLFVFMGFIYLQTAPPTPRRLFIATEPLFALVITFGGIWIVRFLYTPFVYLVILSGILMVGSYIWMSLVVLSSCIRGNRSSAD